MNNGQEFEKIERERKVRRKVFYLTFAALALIFGGILTWKLRSLILPIIVGALLAFLFRPVKERFRIRWLPRTSGPVFVRSHRHCPVLRL